MAALLVYGDTVRMPELRHEVPLGIPDAFLFAEIDGEGHVAVSSLEIDRMGHLGLAVHPWEEYGWDELVASGMDVAEARLELIARASRALGVGSAKVPAAFPLAVAERLRAEGVELVVDQAAFDERRRVKNDAELAGIRRAQRAADAAMHACRDLLAEATPRNGGLVVDGEVLTSELVKRRIDAVFQQHGVTSEEFIVSHGPQTAVGHDGGSGAIAPGEPVVVDLWPRDRESACYTDMTRTFVVGGVPDELRELHRLTREALGIAVRVAKPGVHGRRVYDAVCDLFEAAGYPTGRSKEPGTVLRDGFFHGLGHGVGLEVHERPGISRYGDELVVGDVITLEPGLYRHGFGGVRLEDTLLVTPEGAESLTAFPYDLEVS